MPLARRLATPSLTTLHGRLDLPGLTPLYSEFTDLPLVSVSDVQRIPLAGVGAWFGTVYHGLPRNLYHRGDGGGGYFAFLGRISPEKRLDRAVEIARATGTPLRVAAKIDPADRPYYEEQIAPLMDDPLIEFVGELTDREKQPFLGEARALLFPIDWPEPFGLVMIEALACGTPVLAFQSGSVREVLEDGTTGFVVDNMASAIDAASRLHEIDRGTCRAVFEARFTAERMAASYVTIYERLLLNER